MPSATQHRVVLGQQPLLVAVVVAVDLDRASARSVVCTTASSFLVTRTWCGLGGGLDVPVAERLVEQVVDGVRGPSSPAGVVGGVRLGLVVRRDLEVAPGLEVDVAQLDPPPPRLAGPSGGPDADRPDQRVGVEQVAAHPGQHAEERARLIG